MNQDDWKAIQHVYSLAKEQFQVDPFQSQERTDAVIRVHDLLTENLEKK